jgi:hypothetical protein
LGVAGEDAASHVWSIRPGAFFLDSLQPSGRPSNFTLRIEVGRSTLTFPTHANPIV